MYKYIKFKVITFIIILIDDNTWFGVISFPCPAIIIATDIVPTCMSFDNDYCSIDVANKTLSFSKIVAEVPGPVPSEPTVTDRADNRISLRWDRPEKDPETILVYMVEARSATEDLWRQVKCDEISSTCLCQRA